MIITKLFLYFITSFSNYIFITCFYYLPYGGDYTNNNPKEGLRQEGGR